MPISIPKQRKVSEKGRTHGVGLGGAAVALRV